MNPGRELDALIAEKVMAWVVSYQGTKDMFMRDPTIDEDDLGQSPLYAVPPYSTDIAAAWEVVEKMKLSVVNHHGSWLAGPTDYSEARGEDDRLITAIIGIEDGNDVGGNTAPHAICLAALKAVEGK